MTRQEQLQSYFDFSEDDLKNNRLGRVTVNQKQALQEKTKKEAVRLFGILAGVGLLIFVVGRIRFPSDNPSFLWKMLAVFLAIGIVSMVFRIIKRSNISLNSISGEVNFVWQEEKIRDTENIHNYTTIRRLKMWVGRMSFDVDKSLQDIIHLGDNVRFYYTSGGDIISAEFVEKA